MASTTPYRARYGLVVLSGNTNLGNLISNGLMSALGLTIGANVSLTNTALSIGNSTVNALFSAGQITINGANVTTKTYVDAADALAMPKTGGTFTGNVDCSASLTISGAAVATQTYVGTQITNLVNGAPGILDTLGEIATALQNDESTAAALATTVAGKQAASANLTLWAAVQPAAYVNTSALAAYMPLSGGTFTGVVTLRALNTNSTAAADTLVIQNVSGTGDANLASIGFVCNGQYGLNLNLRADGIFGIGGSSRAAWSWYSDSSGNMVAAGNVTAYSDPLLKEKFEPIVNALTKLKSLVGGSFFWKEGIPQTALKSGKKDYGVLADAVEKIMPEAVHDTIEIDGKSYKGVDYLKLIPLLIEAVRELDEKLEKAIEWPSQPMT